MYMFVLVGVSGDITDSTILYETQHAHISSLKLARDSITSDGQIILKDKIEEDSEFIFP